VKTYWRGLIRFEAQKIVPRRALRNAIGIGIPLAAGVALGQPAGGLLACVGALDVAYSDGSDPYQFRARRMLAASAFVAVAIFVGRIAGEILLVRLAALAICGFLAGIMVALGPVPTDIGNITLVTLIVFSANPTPPGDAALSALAALGGALFQTGLTLLFWPLNRYVPERSTLAALYRALARAAADAKEQSAPAMEPPVASSQSTEAQQAIAALGGDSSMEAARYLMLASQAERIRLSIMVLTRQRIRLAREGKNGEASVIDDAMAETSALLNAVASSVESDQPWRGSPVRQPAKWEISPELSALAGQLRAAAELAAHSTPAGLTEFARQEARKPWRLRLGGAVGTLRANLCPDSGAFRHAVRLAVVVPVATLGAAMAGWQRGYWAAMTAAIVLRPDFTTTFSRSVLRIAGTLLGLGISTALFHYLAPPIGWQVALLTVTAFLLRCYGPANYGIFAVALTALIVLLFAATGVAPGTVIVARGLNTAGGGVLALVAYRLWPTWERTQITDVLAGLLDAYRRYFRAVSEGYLSSASPQELDGARLAARLARSNLEASVARLRSEPGTDPLYLARIDSIVANSLRLVHAMMALEAGLYGGEAPAAARPPFRPYTEHVDVTLYYLAAALRGSPVQPEQLPDVRADHRALVEAGEAGNQRHALVDVETDRITNSLNTLAKDILDVKATARSGR
jgi:uncharacterized membrane protein YccC